MGPRRACRSRPGTSCPARARGPSPATAGGPPAHWRIGRRADPLQWGQRGRLSPPARATPKKDPMLKKLPAEHEAPDPAVTDHSPALLIREKLLRALGE